MGRSIGKAESDEDTRARQLPVWAGRYARNRTLPMVVFLLVLTVSIAVLCIFAYVAGRARDVGNLASEALFAVAAAITFAWVLWFRFVAGRDLSRHIADVLYSKEGIAVTEPMDQAQSMAVQLSAAHFLLLACVTTWVALALLEVIPHRYLLAAYALFAAPFTVYFYTVRYRGTASTFMLLWPLLYTVHALLFVLGVPIYITGGPDGVYETLNLLIPILGYGLLAALIGHLYSRLALRRLRSLAAPSQHDDTAEVDQR